ncbi:MAG: DUF2815 family protein [Candidatus Saccharibacteria bacterium]|nr:DUF2815 family protein [Candidatus Saccharibacteria bacterium]
MSIVTPEFRVSYPNVFKAQVNKLSGREEFSIVALFPKGADLSKLKAAAQEAMVKKWGSDKAKWPKNIRSPFRDQGERAKEVDGKMVMPAGHEEGAIFLNLKSANRPGVVDQNVQDIIDESQFYAGCFARASLNAYAYDQAGNRGVSFGLGNIQKTKDGDPLGNRARPEHEFAPIKTEGGSAASDDLFG